MIINISPKQKIATILIAVVCISGSWIWLNQLLKPVGNQSDSVMVTINSGDSVAKVARTLYDKKLVRNKTAFVWYIKYKNLSSKIQTGEYDLNQTMSVADLVTAIISGDHLSKEQQLTIIEGWTAKQIGVYVQQKMSITSEDWQKAIATEKWRAQYTYLEGVAAPTVEGFLFPDTYRVFKNGSAEDVVKKMLDQFDRQLTEQMRHDIATQKKTVFEVVTLASIVEREAGLSDMPMVADIFWKRLDVGMGLQSDATVNYVTGQGRTRPTLDDLAVDSPYNTYKYRGLPPGPISSPGLVAIKATIYPTANDFYYFLTDSAGKAYYARTYQEHQKNIAAYLD